MHTLNLSYRLVIIFVVATFCWNCQKTEDPIILDDTPQTEINEGNIYFTDLEGKSLYDIFMIESLQGNVNRISPLIWVLKTPLVEYGGPGKMVDRSFWLNTISDTEKIKFNNPFVMVRDFADKIDGCVIYENTLFGTYKSGARHPQPMDNIVARLNATAMLCAKHNAVALTENQHKILIDKYGIELPILANTTTDDFSNWQSTYNYMYNNFSQDFSTEMMANNSHYCLGMFDFLIKNKMFIINMKGNPTTLDQNLTDDIFNRCPNPSPVSGVWNVAGGTPNEDSYQKYLNNQGKYAIVNFEAFNLSYTSSLPEYVPEKSETKRNLEFDPSKKYISFTETDGDNYEFIQQIFPKKFEVLGRKSYPIGWEIPSTLCELDPVAAKWFFSNIGDNCFVNPVTGAGYYKYILPEQYLGDYFALTDSYMTGSKYRTIRTMWYNLEDGRPLTEISSVEGVFCGYGGNDATKPSISDYPQTHEIYNGKPIFINYSYLDINSIINYNGSSPAFFSVACVYTHPSDVINSINSLSNDWVVVSPAELIDIYKQYAGM
ncbi:MAG: hypothetical protein HQ521_11290 [Bacteroidetes bacterium]|nr:hypothetical protein [Bacteroidota bacterium]